MALRQATLPRVARRAGPLEAATMTVHFVGVLLAGALIGGFINGLAGFGTALLALGIWLQVLPAQQAIALVLVTSVLSGLQGLWIVRRDIRRHKARLARYLLPAVAGLPLGFLMVPFIDTAILKITIAVLLVSYGVYFMARRSLSQFDRSTPIADAIVGFIGGVMGGAASLSGAIPTMWVGMRPWPKGEMRAVLQPFNVVVLALTGAYFAWLGAYSGEVLMLVAIALPGTLAGAQLGIFAFHRLGHGAFRWLLIFLLFGSGLLIAGGELL